MIKYFLFLLSFMFLISCTKNEEEYRTVPTTNNPNIVPSHAPSVPGMPSPR